MKVPVLYVIGFVFAGLLLVRSVGVSSEAAALDIADSKADISQAEGRDKAPNSGHEGLSQISGSGLEKPKLCLTGDVLEVVRADKAKVAERLAMVEAREQTLATLQTKLSAQVKQIESANAQLEEKIIAIKDIATDDIKHLVDMYKVMKPKQAADIFNSMDPGFAAGFLREMGGDQAGLIMANMDPRKSYSISILMASKNAKYR